MLRFPSNLMRQIIIPIPCTVLFWLETPSKGVGGPVVFESVDATCTGPFDQNGRPGQFPTVDRKDRVGQNGTGRCLGFSPHWVKDVCCTFLVVISFFFFFKCFPFFTVFVCFVRFVRDSPPCQTLMFRRPRSRTQTQEHAAPVLRMFIVIEPGGEI